MIPPAIVRLVRLQGQVPATATAAFRGLATEPRSEEHVLVTEQQQGHLLERMQDPEEVRRLMHLKQQHHWHHSDSMPHLMTSETMADTILRETLEAQEADLERRMQAKGSKVLCEHGHAHDVCCGASKDEVQAEE